MSISYQRFFARRKSAMLGGLLAILVVAALPVRADIVLASTLSTSVPPFDPATGDSWQVGLASNTELAVGFQDPSASLSYLLSQIQVADNFSVSDPNSSTNPALNDLIVGIWQSTTNDPNTATELQSWNITAPGATGNPGQLYTLTSALPTTINPGDFYFITENVTPDGANTSEWGWQENNLTPMQIGLYFGTLGTPGSFSFANTPCTNPGPCTAVNDPDASGTPAYSVSGNAIATPEPSYAPLFGGAILIFLILARRRNVLASAKA
jgi:hypothetical protein